MPKSKQVAGSKEAEKSVEGGRIRFDPFVLSALVFLFSVLTRPAIDHSAHTPLLLLFSTCALLEKFLRVTTSCLDAVY